MLFAFHGYGNGLPFGACPPRGTGPNVHEGHGAETPNYLCLMLLHCMDLMCLETPVGLFGPGDA